MFRTHDSALAGIPGMFGEGYSNWHVVGRLLDLHCFHVCLEHSQEGRRWSFIQMTSDVKSLKEILNQGDSSTVVTELQVMTPAWMNKWDSWKMEKLVSLAIGYDQLGVAVSVIEVAGGQIYTDVHADNFDPSSLTDVCKIY